MKIINSLIRIFNSTSNRKDIREQNLYGTISYHPDPTRYTQTENMMAANIVTDVKAKQYEVVTRTNGKINTSVQPMHADKTMRLKFELEN